MWFEAITGFHVNYEKSNLYLINEVPNGEWLIVLWDVNWDPRFVLRNAISWKIQGQQQNERENNTKKAIKFIINMNDNVRGYAHQEMPRQDKSMV